MKEYKSSNLSVCKIKNNNVIDEQRDISKFWKDPDYKKYDYRLNIFSEQPEMKSINHFGVKTTAIGDLFDSYQDIVNGFADFYIHKKYDKIHKFQEKLKSGNLSDFDRKFYRDCIQSQKRLIQPERFYDDVCMLYRDLIITMTIPVISQIDAIEFKKCLYDYLEKCSEFVPCKNLQDYNKVSGIYMLVLDKMNQVYIGQSNDMKRRITRHWSEKQEYPHGIDLYGPLDTTQIFVYSLDENYLDNEEIHKITAFESDFSLNSSIGGSVPTEFLDHSYKKEMMGYLYNNMPKKSIRVIDLGYENFLENYGQLYTHPIKNV